MAGFTSFPCSLQKLPYNGEEGMFVSMFKFHLPFHTMAVKLPFTLVFRSPPFNFVLCPKYFGIAFLFCLKVPQFNVLACKLSKMKRNCPQMTCVPHVQSLQQLLLQLHV